LGGKKGIRPVKKWGMALFSPDGVAPSRMFGVSASVNLPLHRKVHKFSSGTGSNASVCSWREHTCFEQVQEKIKGATDTIEHHTTQPFYGPFSGTTWVSRCQKRTSGLYVTRED